MEKHTSPPTLNLNTFFKACLPLFVTAALALFMTSCGGDSATGTNGGNGGNGGTQPPEPTFANVQEIFNNSCGGSGCHINRTESGVRLDGYDNVMNSVGQQYGTEIVQANEPDNSPLVDKIEPDPQFGDRMPQGRSPLTDDQIQLIRDWINQGAQNN